MALKGIKVVELAGLAPVPFCGMILADFGAQVTKVDKIGEMIGLDCLANGKKSISLNLKEKRGVNIIKQMCKDADVLLEPFRHGVMEKLGIGPNDLMKDCPQLVYARLSGFGQKGVFRNRPGHDINYVALSGLLSLFGRKNEKPTFPANLAADFGGGGLMCALGILLALLERKSSGLGQVVDCSMVEGTAYLGSWLYRSHTLPIPLWDNNRGENILDSGSHYYEVYKTKDGKYMSVGAIEPQFYIKLLQGLNISIETAPHMEKFEESKRLFEEKFLEKTQEEWCKIFDKIDACVMPVLDLDEAPLHEHNSESFVKTEEGIFPKPAPKLSRTPGITQCTEKSSHRGEHTIEILRNLKYTDEDIQRLERDGVIECWKKSNL